MDYNFKFKFIVLEDHDCKIKLKTYQTCSNLANNAIKYDEHV